jgi:hypothetical protein
VQLLGEPPIRDRRERLHLGRRGEFPRGGLAAGGGLGERAAQSSPCHAATMGGGNGEVSRASLLFRKQFNEPEAPNPGPIGSASIGSA